MNRPGVHWTSVKSDIDNFFDIWNGVGLVVGVMVILLMFHQFGVTTQTLLVAITAVYAFTSFNQMRRSNWGRKYPGTLTVRPAFEWNDEEERFDFGLKNFGTGPAINLRGCAIVRGENDGEALDIWRNGDEESVWQFSSKEHHLSLPESELLSLTTESRLTSLNRVESLDDLWSETTGIKEQYKGKRIEFYYTFESNTGEQYPRDWSKPAAMDMETVIGKAQLPSEGKPRQLEEGPRAVEIAEIEAKCGRPFSLVKP